MKRGPKGLWVPDYDGHAETIAAHAARYDTFRPLIPGNMVAIDAGAHVGYWSLLMAPEFKMVYALEPHPDNYACLIENILEAWRKNIAPMRVGLGHIMGPAEMRRNANTTDDNSGAWHMFLDYDGDATVVALDSLYTPGRIDLLKLDIEGMEAAALRGGREVIQRDKPTIIIELNTAASENYGRSDREQEQLLRDWGYLRTAQSGNDHLFQHPERK